MIVASIDVGTNTVLLLIAKVDSDTHKIISLHNEYRMPRIGSGTKQTGIISTDRLTLLFDVLSEYDKIIQDFHCDKVILTGTNAFRMAKNTPEIMKEINKLFNFELDVISGEEEAEYAYCGAISDLDDYSFSMVIDIGGSSTEVIIGEGKRIISKNSLQLGSVSVTEQILKNSPPLKSEIENLRKDIKILFSSIDNKINPAQVIAIAGTATTLACMQSGLKEFEEERVDKSIITIEDMKNIIGELFPLTPAQILERYGPVMRGRQDIIFAGAFILYQFMVHFGIENVAVSTRGIRYGAIVKYLENLI
jgi:exopolyphosphatase/guanosine-5'-triphosphate,3'-diphosphate pyrophosphatase